MTIHPVSHAPACGCDTRGRAALSIDAALTRIAVHARPLEGSEPLPLTRATGRILAQPVLASAMVPPFDNAAMDGYALHAAALTGTGPWHLQVIDRVPAGRQAVGDLSAHTAARIFTGAPIPAGADAVVMQEDVVREGDRLTLRQRPAPGLNIRKAGSDMAAGSTVLEAGRRLGAREIAVCAAAGAGLVNVAPRLRVALLVTGDELRDPSGSRARAQIWDVNGPMLAALLKSPAVDLVSQAHAADNRAEVAGQLAGCAAEADLVITTGGLSVGEEDHVKPALTGLGAEILFSGVAIKPGKPVSFGRLGRTFWLGLPGNPLSAFVTWQVFGTTLVRRLTGRSDPPRMRRHVILSEPIRRTPGRCELRPAILDGFDAQGREVVRFEAATHSARVRTLPATDGLMFLPAEADYLPAGALVEFQPFCDA